MENKFIITDGLKHADLSSDDPTIWNLFGVPRNSDDVRLYSRVAAAYRAYNIKAKMVGNMPFCLYKSSPKGDAERKTNIKAIDEGMSEGDEVDNSASWQNVVKFLPNPKKLFELNTLSYIATNTIYVLRTSDALGWKIKGLKHVIPYNFTPRLNGAGTDVEYIERQVGTLAERYTFPEDKRLFRMWKLDHTTELLPSPYTEAMAIMNAAGIINNEQFWIRHFFETGAIPPTVVAMKGAIAPDRQKEEQSKWTEFFMRVKRFVGSPVRTINGELLEVKQLGSSIKELQNNETHNQALADIAMGMGMPLSLLLANSANYATAKEEVAMWMDSEIIPFCNDLAYEYNAQIFNPMGLYIEFHPETLDPQQEDETERASAMLQYANVLEKCATKEIFMGLASTLGLEVSDELEAALDAFYAEKKKKEEEMRAQMQAGGYTVGPDGKPLPAQAQPKDGEKPGDKPMGKPMMDEGDDDEEEKKPAPKFPAKWVPSLDELEEMRIWREVALRKLKKNESMDFDYEPHHGGLPANITLDIKADLAVAKTPEDVKAAFDISELAPLETTGSYSGANLDTPESDLKVLAAGLNRLADALGVKQVSNGVDA